MLGQVGKLTKDDKERNFLSLLIQSYLFEYKYDRITAPELEKYMKVGRKRLNSLFAKFESKGYITKIKKKPVVYTLTDTFVERLDKDDF